MRLRKRTTRWGSLHMRSFLGCRSISTPPKSFSQKFDERASLAFCMEISSTAPCVRMFTLATKSGSPRGIPTRDRRAPIRQAIVTDFNLWIGMSVLETALWLVGHDDHKLGAGARLRA